MDDIKKRLDRSTDAADGVVQSFWDGEMEGFEPTTEEYRDGRLAGRR